MGRTGKFLACEHDGVVPDGVILGKALGGGVLPVSAFVATEDVMQVFSPGDHGSTFGGNPLAAAVGLEAIAVLFDDKLIERSAELGAYLLAQLKTVRSSLIRDVRGKGLFIGLEVDARKTDARGGRRSPAGAGHHLQGHARHRRSLRAAAGDRPRAGSTGRSAKCARCSPRSTKDCAAASLERRQFRSQRGAILGGAQAHARRQAGRRDFVARAVRSDREPSRLHRGRRRRVSPLPDRARG